MAINAHLLSHESGYRSAGIHSYIYNVLIRLDQFAPADWSFHAWVGAGIQHKFPRIHSQQSRLNTQSPLKRIFWEQGIQPFSMHGYDLVHEMAFVAPILKTAPIIITVYDLSFVHYPQALGRMRRIYLNRLTGRSCRRAERVIAISQSTADDLMRQMSIPAHKIDVTPLGYDQSRFHPFSLEEREQFIKAKKLPERFWLYLGTIEPRKNLVMLLHAYARLEKRLPLILAGGHGWGINEVKHTIQQLGLEADVLLPGYLDLDEIGLYYACADCFLYPSLYEGFGLPVLEAMACGTPTITSNISSLPEVAGEAALTLAPDDIAAWTKALQLAYTSAAWRDESSQLGLECARFFTWENTAKLTVESYCRALEIN